MCMPSEEARLYFARHYWDEIQFFSALRGLSISMDTQREVTHINIFQNFTPHCVAQMSWTGQPGCECEVVISHGVFIDSALRGHGIGEMFLRLRISAWKHAGFKRAIATVREDNAAEIHLLEKTGWIKVPGMDFPGINSGSTVSFYSLDLTT